MRTTWTLCLLCFCYIIFVGPIVLSTLTGVRGQVNLLCFILYWFQVRLALGLWTTVSSKLMIISVFNQLYHLRCQEWAVQESLPALPPSLSALAASYEERQSDLRDPGLWAPPGHGGISVLQRGSPKGLLSSHRRQSNNQVLRFLNKRTRHI